MNWIWIYCILTCTMMVLYCQTIPEGSVKKMFQEVNHSLRQRPSTESVPDFMRELYFTLNNDIDTILSSQSTEQLYRNSPVVKSFRGQPVIRDTRIKFRFNLPRHLSDDFDAQVMVRSRNQRMNVTFRHHLLPRDNESLSDDYQVFNVKMFVNNSIDRGHRHLSLRLHATEILEEYQIYLIIYENINPRSIHHARRRRSLRSSLRYFFLRNITTNTGIVHSNECHYEEWNVDLQTLGWFWIVYPDVIPAGKCVGGCNVFSSNINTTNYSYLKDMYHIQTSYTDRQISNITCVATDFSALNVMYFSNNFDLYVRMLPEMMVAGCKCI